MEINRITPSFAVSPQIRPEDLAAIARAGFRAVVNNRPDGEAPDQPPSAALEAEARRLGLAYSHIPITHGEMREADARALGRVLKAAKGPVLGFCRTGARSSRLWKLTQQLSGHAPL